MSQCIDLRFISLNMGNVKLYIKISSYRTLHEIPLFFQKHAIQFKWNGRHSQSKDSMIKGIVDNVFKLRLLINMNIIIRNSANG